MPHFVIDCSEHIIELISPEEIMQKVYDTAEATALFDKGDIKVRINPYKYYNIGNTKNDFIHIFANIMEGRTIKQKGNLEHSHIDLYNYGKVYKMTLKSLKNNVRATV